jgi:hypothetical protein
MTAIVFLDTETTGLSIEDDIWEFAAVRREDDGSEAELHLFIEHSPLKCTRLPASFLADHQKRFPAAGASKWHEDVVTRGEAAKLIDGFFQERPRVVGQERPHVVGAVPNFDTERIARLCGEWFDDWRAPWHHHLIDVENLAVGYLAAKGEAVPLPWHSDALSARLGITAPRDERHTAMGDVRWAMRIYDAVTSGAES